MFSICVKGKIFRALMIHENQLVVSFELANYSNVIFPKKTIELAINISEIDVVLVNALTILEERVGKRIEIFIKYPKLNKLYELDLMATNFFNV